MCFAKVIDRNEIELELEAFYTEEGEINEQENTVIHQHIDNPLLDDNLETGILAFLYETSYGIRIVYTSFEAELICGDICENCGVIHID